jgi:hypothetical protein
MLMLHPQIYMPAEKEPHYFAIDTVPRAWSWNEYLDHFSQAADDQVTGEASVWYLGSPVAPQAIHDACPDARIIALFREPVSFLRSLHLQLLEGHDEHEPELLKALALESRRRASRGPDGYPRILLYSEHVRYVEQLRRYHELFGRKKVLVLIYDDFKRDNADTLRSVERFLGVDDQVQLPSVTSNPTVRVRSVRLHRGIRTATMATSGPAYRAKRVVKSVTTKTARERLLHAVRRNLVFGAPQPTSEALIQELKQRFRPEVEALSEYIGRNLVQEWGYQHVTALRS